MSTYWKALTTPPKKRAPLLRQGGEGFQLPRQLFAKINKFSRIAVGRERRQRYRSFRSFFDRNIAVRVHVRHDRARVRGVDLDRRVLQLISQMHGVAVQ